MLTQGDILACSLPALTHLWRQVSLLKAAVVLHLLSSARKILQSPIPASEILFSYPGCFPCSVLLPGSSIAVRTLHTDGFAQELAQL